jgi:YHS domain-containing protein
MENQEKDPVCGMSVDKNHCAHKANHKNKEYNFCCGKCLNEFKKNPDKFSK